MPVAWCYLAEDGKKFCDPGFPIGCYVNEKGISKGACVTSVCFCFYNIHVLLHIEST